MPFGNETILHRFFDPLSNAPPDQALQAGKYTMLVHKGLLTNNSPVLSALTAIEPEIFLQDLAAERELPLIECSEFVHDPEAFLVVLRLTYGDVDAELMTALTTDLHLFRLVLATIESLKMGLTKRHLVRSCWMYVSYLVEHEGFGPNRMMCVCAWGLDVEKWSLVFEGIM